MRRRKIDPAERALWHEAMRDVAPREEKKNILDQKTDVLEIISESRKPSSPRHAGDDIRSPILTLTCKIENQPLHAPTPGLDRRSALRLKRGQLPIEARLDLHGLTQAEAHRALAGFVAQSHGAGKRVVLIVTGKGSRDGTGVLKAAVPRWLDEPGLRDRVLAAAPAQPRDGGGGALYLLLRRAR